MKLPQSRIDALTKEMLDGMRHGVEKESLRVDADGVLSATPHPQALGSALTHPNITTDFSESQLELVTGVHARVEDTLGELVRVHQVVCRELARNGEMMWVASMPCRLPGDETIPLGRYGSSNVGRAKSVYRMGLGHRYGRRMQTISGIHYNWSLPGLDNVRYFGLIRNFRRHAFALLYLFGASPMVCGCFANGRDHMLEPVGSEGRTLGLPHATSLRMGRLGYQSDAQASLAVSYNSLEGYAASLYTALTEPYPPYEAIGIRNLGGEYNQLGTSLLQIENEFYGTIRPKRVTRPGERPLHALHERGVEYVEVRLMDLDPFERVGINASTMRFLDLFLLHSLLADSAPDTPDEIAALADNQQLTASRGREPGLRLTRGGEQVVLTEWIAELLDDIAPLAARVDELLGGTVYGEALAMARSRLEAPASLPSARVFQVVTEEFGNSFSEFVVSRSALAHAELSALPFADSERVRFADLATASLRKQAEMEAADTMSFEEYRQIYVSPEGLLV